MKVYHQLFVFNNKEKLRRRTRRVRSRSFLKPFLYKLCPSFGGGGITTIDIDNVGAVPTGTTSHYKYIVVHPGGNAVLYLWNGGINYTTNADEIGVQVGTGTNAVAITNYKLQTPILNGSTSGKLEHKGTWVCNYTVGASSASFDIEKIFYNGSGGSITINEIGVYQWVFGGNISHCILRDKLSSGVAVGNTEYVKVKYTVTVSV